MPDTSAKLSAGATLDDILEPRGVTRVPRSHTTSMGDVIYDLDSTDHSRITGLLSRVNERYDVPADREQELAELVQEYQTTKGALEKGIERWKTRRGNNTYDLEFVLTEECADVYAVMLSAEEFEQASGQLSVFLEYFPVKGGPKKKAAWHLEAIDG